ncbi:uncharacterized protein LOC115959601 [Quercus lobata]|uniref:uncharacterized protein LOC115959601 n=1 Tax=Quercus lobata TaxID=97700 RepID=UPI0012445BF5|nr:uncharacterized protein LOC115959601 [Quercus lobata]
MSIEDAEARERVLGDKLKHAADGGEMRGENIDPAQQPNDLEHEKTRDSSSSSSDGSNEAQQSQENSEQNIAQSTTLLQRPQGTFEVLGVANTAHMQEAGRSVLSNSTSAITTQSFHPTTIESSQLQPFNHGRDMSLIPRNQLGLASQSAFHVENFVPSRTSGIVFHGLIFPINHQTKNFGSINTYQLPTSSLPPEFRLESSSRMQLPQIQQPQSQVSTPLLLESGSGGSQFRTTQWANWHPQNQITMPETSTTIGSREIQFQGLLTDQATGSSSFFPTGGSSSQIQIPNIPIQQKRMQGSAMTTSQNGVEEPWKRNVRMKMAWQENNPPMSNLQLPNWISPGQGPQGQNFGIPNASGSISRPRSLKNSVYDQMYESMGLHVDPHLRMFVARRETGSSEAQ